LSRQQPCNRTIASERASYAREQWQLAEVGAPWEQNAQRKASGACAVLAAIAAADAICCARIGRRSRGQDHREGLALLQLVEPNGSTYARDLEVALATKDLMQYGTNLLSPSRHQSLLRATRRLVNAAGAATSAR
jgi:hypothetical protein